MQWTVLRGRIIVRRLSSIHLRPRPRGAPRQQDSSQGVCLAYFASHVHSMRACMIRCDGAYAFGLLTKETNTCCRWRERICFQHSHGRNPEIERRMISRISFFPIVAMAVGHHLCLCHACQGCTLMSRDKAGLSRPPSAQLVAPSCCHVTHMADSTCLREAWRW